MAVVTLGLPIFEGKEDDDVNTFINLFQGYLHGINVDPVANSAQALGILRGCMKGESANWFDEYILGKRWHLSNLYNNTGQGNIAGIRARTMAELLGTNSIKPGTDAYTYANIGGNNAVTVTDAGSTTVPGGNAVNRWIPVQAFDQDWSIIGGEPTDDAVNNIANPGNNRPIVFPELRIGNAIYILRTQFPSVLNEKRKIRFGSLYQENNPIRVFYNKVKRYGKLLGFSPAIIEDQVLKGLSPENMVETDRIGLDRPLDDIIDSLERIEKHKKEMNLSQSNKDSQRTIIQAKYIPPVELGTRNYTSLSQQEPVVMSSENIIQDQINKMFKTYTDNLTQSFQTQFQTLQDKITNVSKPEPSYHPVVPQIAPELQPAHSLTSSELLKLQQSNRNLVESMLYPAGSDKIAQIAERIAKKMAKNEQKKLDKEIATSFSDMFSNLDISDNSATSNLVRSQNINDSDDDDEYCLQVVRKKK